MKNHYFIFSKSGFTKEIIEKAFKILAKRYHPDAHDDEKKEWAENKFKEINEAYAVLSDDEKRKNYDIELDYAKNGEIESLQVRNAELELIVESLKSELNNLKANAQTRNIPYNTNDNISINYNENVNPYFEKIKRYKQVNNSKNHFKDFIALLITIFCIIALGFILWKIPFTRNFLINLYENNEPIKNFVNFFIK